MMTFATIIPLFGAIFMFLLALFIFLKNKKSKLNIIFSFVCLSIALWLFGTFMMFLNRDNDPLAIFWDRICYIGVIFIPTLMYHFSVTFSGVKKQTKLIIIGYILSFIFLILSRTDYFVSDLFVYKWGVHSKAKLFHHVFLIFFSIYLFLFYFNIYQCYRKSSGVLKVQSKYLFLAFIIMLIGAVAYLPAYDVSIHPIVYLAELIGATIIAYAIIRHRLMDIRVVLGRGTIYIFSFLTIIALAFFLMFLLNEKIAPSLPLNISGPLIIVVSILLFQPIFKFFERFASKYFYYTFYSYQKVLTDLGKKLTQVLELEQLSSLIVRTLIETMKLDRTVVLLRDEKGDYQIQKNIGFKEENGISLVRDNFLTNFLAKMQKPLVYEEISLILQETDKKEERERLEKLKLNMKKIEANVCLPLLIENKIIGLIILGNKISGEPYSEQDINLLTNLSNQASIALANARLYSKVKDLSKNLERRVNEQVEHIEKLLQMKTEFLRIVNHQLRTPITIVMGLLSMICEKKTEEKEKKEMLTKAYLSSQRLIAILDDLLNAQELIGQKPSLNLEPCQIEDIVLKVIDHFKFVVSEKGLSLNFKKPEKSLPKILLDKEKIERVLKKLIDNAILYTKKGEVTITVNLIKENKKEFLEIKIKDTGIGLTESDKEKLFKLFSRGEGAKLHPNGSGLGLYIAKEYIKAHQGKIETRSEGENKGTTFIISLPIITEV